MYTHYRNSEARRSEPCGTMKSRTDGFSYRIKRVGFVETEGVGERST